MLFKDAITQIPSQQQGKRTFSQAMNESVPGYLQNKAADKANKAIKIQQAYQQEQQNRAWYDPMKYIQGAKSALGMETRDVLPEIPNAPKLYQAERSAQQTYQQQMTGVGNLWNQKQQWSADVAQPAVKQFIQHPVQTSEKLLIGGLETFMPSETRAAKTIADAVDWSLATAGDYMFGDPSKPVKPMTKENYPDLYGKDATQVSKELIGAAVERILFKTIPTTQKMGLISRLGFGGFQAAAFSIANDIGEGKNAKEIMDNAKTNAQFGSAIELILPYLAPLGRKIPIINSIFEENEGLRNQFLKDIKLKEQTIKDFEQLYGKSISKEAIAENFKNSLIENEIKAPTEIPTTTVPISGKITKAEDLASQITIPEVQKVEPTKPVVESIKPTEPSKITTEVPKIVPKETPIVETKVSEPKLPEVTPVTQEQAAAKVERMATGEITSATQTALEKRVSGTEKAPKIETGVPKTTETPGLEKKATAEVKTTKDTLIEESKTVEQKISGVAQKAREARVKLTNKDLENIPKEGATYGSKKIEVQDKKSADIINNDTERAIRILNGTEELPAGHDAGSFTKVAELFAIRNVDDVALSDEILSAIENSKLSSAVSEAASTVSMRQGIGESPLRAKKDVESAMQKRGGTKMEEAVTRRAKTIKDSAKTQVTIEKAQSILDKIMCK